MTFSEAASIIRQLLSGVDPETGEVQPTEHLLYAPAVREALLTALQVMEMQETTGSVQVTRSGRLPANRPWTEADLADLRNLYESGMSVDEIARLTHRRARGIRLQLNLTNKHPHDKRGMPWTKADDVSLANMFRDGQDIPQLAETFGRSPRGIEKRLQKLGLLPDENDPDSVTRPWTDAEVGILHGLALRGLSAADIATRMNRTEEAVNARIFYLGLDSAAPALFPAGTPAPPRKKTADAPAHDSPAAPSPLPEKVAAAISPSRRWTPEEDAYLRQAWADGVGLPEIARRTNRRDRLVRCRLVFLGLGDRSLLDEPPLPPELAHQGLPWYPEEIEALHRMFRQGLTPEAMAAQLLRSVGVVRSRLELLGLSDDKPE